MSAPNGPQFRFTPEGGPGGRVPTSGRIPLVPTPEEAKRMREEEGARDRYVALQDDAESAAVMAGDVDAIEHMMQDVPHDPHPDLQSINNPAALPPAGDPPRWDSTRHLRTR